MARHLTKFFRGDDAARQPPGHSLLGADGLVAHQYLSGTLGSNDLRQQRRPAPIRAEPYDAVVRCELSLRSQEHDVTSQHQPERTARDRAMHRPHNRLGQVDELQNRLVQQPNQLASVRFDAIQMSSEAAQVPTRGERAAAGLQHDHPNVRSSSNGLQPLQQRLQQSRNQAVVALGAVQGEHSDTLINLQ